jgi:hypothetical protein
MRKIAQIFDKSYKINLALFLLSFLIYFFHFHSIFLNINSILSSITLDSLKNYYTFVYHIKNDAAALDFRGMNFPYGEHIVYTDCQPILTFLLRLLPFTHGYLIGIMHSLMFFSFIISPLILNKIFKLLGVDSFTSFFLSLGTALLAPQYLKINAGHFALAYGFVAPLSILLILFYFKDKKTTALLNLFLFNTLLFFLHPYLGFCACILTFVSLVLFDLFHFDRRIILKNILFSLFSGLLPLFIFKFFMLLTDHHLNRTDEPYGAEVMVENVGNLMAPEFGPFKQLMEFFFHNRTQHFEGHTYLGFFTILLTLLFLLGALFFFKKLAFDKRTLALLIASFFLLFFALGLHISLFKLLSIKSAALNQFRATCRFAWFFYYTLPVFILPVIYHSLKANLTEQKSRNVLTIVSLLFFLVNLLEAHYYFKQNEDAFWKFRNIFNESFLSTKEKEIVKNIKNSRPQAILPLPMFHGGSEMYDRTGSNNSMIPSMMYSYHSGVPIMSVLMSRTSITETEETIQLLNSYKKERPAAKLLNDQPFFIIKSSDPLLPDEERLSSKVAYFSENDTLKFGYITKKNLLARKLNENFVMLDGQKSHLPDSLTITFIPCDNRKPFLPANINDFESIYTLDSNKIKAGYYVVSFHYHYKKRVYRSVACDLIVTQVQGKEREWKYVVPVRYLSGFYPGFAVFEHRIYLSPENKYDFLLKGYIDQEYHISDFMLRPENIMVTMLSNNRDTIFNNFPD